MAGVDTNVLVRWLVNDDPRPSAQITALLEKCAIDHEVRFVPVTVVLELEWVLRSRYEFEKRQVVLALDALLETREREFQMEPAVERALHAYQLGKADFAEGLHACLCAVDHRGPMLTFDTQAAKSADALLIRG